MILITGNCFRLNLIILHDKHKAEDAFVGGWHLKRYYFYTIIIAFVIPLLAYWYISHLPIGLAFMFSDFKTAELHYIPFNHKKPYATVVSAADGFGVDAVRTVYEGSNQKLVFKVSHLERLDDPKWKKDTLINGSNYYFQERDKKEILQWQDEKDNEQFTITYTGERLLPKNEIFKEAESVEVK
jgi:hypothetical protein